jgi:hypothetical protein
MKEMTSRYDFMQPGLVVDEEVMDQYPDPLTANFAEGKLKTIPVPYAMTSADLDKFWKFFYDTYGKLDVDEIFHSINGVPYLGMLEPGSVLFKLNVSDIEKWLSDQSPDDQD